MSEHPREPRAADEVAEAARALSAHWRGRAERAEAERDAMLASDADRDAALQLLATAHGDGRLPAQEHDSRADHVLRSRTIGELDDALAGLGGYRRTPPPTSVARKVLFWVAAVPTSPFLLMGILLVLFGNELDDRLWGLVLLVVLSPGLWALRRWAWPRA